MKLSLPLAVLALAAPPSCNAFGVMPPSGHSQAQAFAFSSRSENNGMALYDASSSSSSELESSESEREEEESPSAPTPTPTPEASSPPVSSTSSSSSTSENLLFLQTLGAITGRGEFASDDQHDAASKVVTQLEEEQQASSSSSLYGRWELVYCSTQLFRSSPFFMAGRAVCQTDRERDQYNWFCDMHRKALAISTIQAVRQIITRSGQLVSEFEVSAGAIPFLRDLTPFAYSGGLPLAITGAIVSTADYTLLLSNNDDDDDMSIRNDLELYMDTVEIKGSNLPLLRRILDQPSAKLQSRKLADVLEQALPNNSYTTPRPQFRTTFLKEKFRISRDQDDNIFVYVKTSSDDTLTDYSAVEADLGVFSLLEGFNDAVTRIYL